MEVLSNWSCKKYLVYKINCYINIISSYMTTYKTHKILWESPFKIFTDFE